MPRELLAPTTRRKMTRQRAAAIFLREQGQCYVCGRQLRVGVDKYDIEHPEALILGGSDDDADLRVICKDCHKPKTKADAAARAQRDRIITSTYEVMEGERRSNWGKRRLGDGNNQHTATRPIRRRFET